MSSHNPNHALYLEGNVVLLKDGKILKEGKASEIITIDILKNIYGDNIEYSKNLPYQEVSLA